MSWYAAEKLGEAATRTRELLTPFDWKTWSKLMVLVLFTGGINLPTNVPLGGDSGTGTGSGEFDTSFEGVGGEAISASPASGLATAGTTTASVIIGLLMFLVITFVVLSNIFEFVYYQSLLDKRVSIRSNFRKHFWNGIRYLLFRIGVVLLIALPVIGAGVAGFSGLSIFLVLLMALVLLLPLILFLKLTHDFVLLEMIETGEGILPSWRSFYQDLRREWRQVAVYLLIVVAIGMGIALLSIFWLLLTLLVLAIPFGLLAFGAALVSEWLAAVPIILGLVIWIVLILGLKVVVQTFLRYYAILVYQELKSS